MSTEPVPHPPGVDAGGLSERDLVLFIGGADAIEARNHASRLRWIAGLAGRRRCSRSLAAVDGRGGPGVDARALADPVLAGIREDFVAELALTRSCSEAEALALLREAVLATTVLAPAWVALDQTRIGPRHLRACVDLLGDALPEVAAEVLERVLPGAEGIT